MKEIHFIKSDLTPAKNEKYGFEWGTPAYDNHGFFTLDTTQSEILIAGKKYQEWAREFDLPLHIIYAPIMLQNVRNFKRVFEKEYPNGKIRFAGKVNSHPSVFKMMADEGIGADVASLNEMHSALQGGMDPFNMDVNGNAKSNRLIDEAVDKNMFFIADSFEELLIINERAALQNKKARIAIRVAGFNMSNVTDANIFTAGVWSKFGEDIRNIPEIMQKMKQLKHIDFHGFHTHIGSQVTDADAYLEAIGILIDLSLTVRDQGFPIKLMNIGGGFPVDYVTKKEWIYLEERVRSGFLSSQNGDQSKTFVWNNESGGLGRDDNGKINPDVWSGEKMYSDFPKHKMLEKILTGNLTVKGKTMSMKHGLALLDNPELVIEPGRSIAEDSGITLSEVSHVRKVAGNHHLTTLEASVTSFATAMLLPPVNPWTIINEPFRQDKEPFETFIAGNLCYSGDIISKYKVFFQRKPRRGDVVCCYKTGAYDPSFFTSNTNSFPRPTRILVNEKRLVSVLKKKDTFEEIFSL
jgi:diaminopimelate decarboxylase